MTPQGSLPPSLPPSVEESYRRKCIQLKQRMNDVEDANAASIVRLQRMKRGIDKLRLERAFLLEQLAKRTSANVDDSDGSPSPPPTPKEKPLRTKRGHRKPSFLANLESTPARSSGFHAVNHSPSHSDFSQSQTVMGRPLIPSVNGASRRPFDISLPPRDVFELFVKEHKPVLLAENSAAVAQGSYDVGTELGKIWEDMGHEERNRYVQRFETGSYMFDPIPHTLSRRGSKVDVDMADDDDDIEVLSEGPSL